MPRIWISPFCCPTDKEKNEFHAYKASKGVMFIQRDENGKWAEISHENDLSRNGLGVPPRWH